MPNQVSKAKLGSVASCMTCPLCHKLFRDATTIIECLHTFCWKCIFQKLLDEEMECCPVCDIDLGCAPLEKLRPDHNLRDIRANIFPYKRIQVKAPDVATPVTLPAKRKERSLSSLVVSTPRVSTQNGMTGGRSKSAARKASRGSSFIVEKHFRKEEDSSHHPESSSSREILAKFTQNARQNPTAAESSNLPNSDKGRENGSEVWEGKLDLWKPLTCLVEAASRSKSSKFTTQESVAKSESHDNERDLAKTKHKENRLKSKVQAENCTVHVPQESERPKNLRRGRQKKGENIGEFKVPPQVVLDAACAKFEQKNHPIWFSLVASVEQDGDAPLPQIASSYLRIKDGSIPVSLIQNYLKGKLDLANENEVEIKCLGQTVIPSLTSNKPVSGPQVPQVTQTKTAVQQPKDTKDAASEKPAKTSDIPVPPWVIKMPAPLPPPRVKGIIIKEPSSQATRSGLEASLPELTYSRKGNEKVTDMRSDTPISAVQSQIDLLMDEVNKFAEDKVKFFDKWVEIRLVNHLIKLKKKAVLDRAIRLEMWVLRQVKTTVILEAFKRRQYFFDLMRIKKLTRICEEQRKNYDPSCPTAFDDIAVINQLDMDLMYLQTKVKVMEEDMELVMPTESDPEDEKAPEQKIQQSSSTRAETSSEQSGSLVPPNPPSTETNQQPSILLQEPTFEAPFTSQPQAIYSPPVRDITLAIVDEVVQTIAKQHYRSHSRSSLVPHSH